MSYNGWTNYETWAVALWIDNDQGSFESAQEAARDAWDRTDEDDTQEDRKSEATRDLAETLKSQHEDAMPAVEGVFADLLNAALDEVDWDEVASHYIDDVADTNAEGEE